MKNNNKNRKLKFIRAKNSLRLGFSKFYCFEKCSNILKEQSTSKEYLEKLLETAKNSLFKIYKLKLNKATFDILVMDGEDFLKDLHTNRVILSKY